MKKHEQNEVLARVMVLACDGWRCGSHGLSARRAWRTKSSRPEGPKDGPKGRQLEVGPRRGPRLLVAFYSQSGWSKCRSSSSIYGIYHILYGNVEADGGCNVLVVASLDWRCFLSVATSRPESHNFKVGQPHVCYAVTAAGRYDRQSWTLELVRERKRTDELCWTFRLLFSRDSHVLAAMALFKFYNRTPFSMLFDPDLDFMYTSAAQKPLKTPTAVHCMKVMMKKSKR